MSIEPQGQPKAVVVSDEFECTDYDHVQYVQICSDDAGQRLDNFLFRHLKKVPKSRIYNLIRRGEVRVNKARKKAEYKLIVDDIIRLAPIKLGVRKVADAPSDEASSEFADKLQSWIVHEDQRLLVLNKPPGLAVHGGSGVHLGLIEMCRLHFPHAKNWELVHRLDKETSGLVMIAKKRSELRRLHQAFRENKVHKEYWAVLVGQLIQDRHEVNAPLKKNQLAGGARIVRVDPAGQAAQTIFEVQGRSQLYTWVLVKPITGRTHQIRVHAQSLGCPILGDDKYANHEDTLRAKRSGFKGLMLHARKLTLPQDSGPHLVLKASAPKNLQRLLATFS